MDTARQVVRWALPGWVGVLFWTIFVSISLYVQGQADQLTLQKASFFSKMGDLLIPLGVAAVPIGFIIYQTYYWLYWHAPLPSLLRFVIAANDRSEHILTGTQDDICWKGLFGRKLIKPVEKTAYSESLFGFKSPIIMRDYQHNWALAQSAWHLALSDERKRAIADYLIKRVQFLSDIYHSLGASGIALGIAYILYLVYDYLMLPKLWWDIPINFLIVVWITIIFKKGRRDSFYAKTKLMHNTIFTSVKQNKSIWQVVDSPDQETNGGL